MKDNIIARDTNHLKELIKQEIEISGVNCDLNFIDTSKITDMSNLFASSEFNGDISQWDTRNVNDMSYMFYRTQFNKDISKWNTSNVENMEGMFLESEFNSDIREWNVNKVENMKLMFAESKFNLNLNDWIPYSLKSSQNIFFDIEAPYWANKPNNDLIREAINNYQQKKSWKERLEGKMPPKQVINKKYKI